VRVELNAARVKIDELRQSEANSKALLISGNKELESHVELLKTNSALTSKMETLRRALEKQLEFIDHEMHSVCICGTPEQITEDCPYCYAFEKSRGNIETALALTAPPEPSEPKEK
jgi:hypothetical protein